MVIFHLFQTGMIRKDKDLKWCVVDLGYIKVAVHLAEKHPPHYLHRNVLHVHLIFIFIGKITCGKLRMVLGIKTIVTITN